MYDLIFNFIKDNLFNSTDLALLSTEVGSNSMTYVDWLSHSATIVCICLIIAILCLFVRWIFRLVGGLFLLR